MPESSWVTATPTQVAPSTTTSAPTSTITILRTTTPFLSPPGCSSYGVGGRVVGHALGVGWHRAR